MDAKYLACLVLFLSFTVITGDEHEYLATSNAKASPAADTRDAVDCNAVFQAEQTTATASASSGAQKTSVKSGGAVTEGVLKNLSCLLASI